MTPLEEKIYDFAIKSAAKLMIEMEYVQTDERYTEISIMSEMGCYDRLLYDHELNRFVSVTYNYDDGKSIKKRTIKLNELELKIRVLLISIDADECYCKHGRREVSSQVEFGTKKPNRLIELVKSEIKKQNQKCLLDFANYLDDLGKLNCVTQIPPFESPETIVKKYLKVRYGDSI
jgi:hypothetical protein